MSHRHRPEPDPPAVVPFRATEAPTVRFKRGRVPDMWQRIEHIRTSLAIVALILGIIIMSAFLLLGVGLVSKLSQLGDAATIVPGPAPAETFQPEPPVEPSPGCGEDGNAPC